MARIAGGAYVRVTRSSRSSAVSAAGSAIVSRGTPIRVAPASNVAKQSKTLASKAGLEIWATRSAAVVANRSTALWQYARAALCGTRTPLGTPVDPDV